MLGVLILGIAGVTLFFVTAPAPSDSADDLTALAPPVPDATVTPEAASAIEAAVAAATVTDTVTPVPTRVANNDTQFERVLRPLLQEAKRKRQAAAAADPTYWTRLDPRLNSTRLNSCCSGTAKRTSRR
jgi:hypothetical protein